MYFHLAYHATGDATAFAAGPTSDLSFDCNIPAGRTGGAAGERLATFKRLVCVNIEFTPKE